MRIRIGLYWASEKASGWRLSGLPGSAAGGRGFNLVEERPGMWRASMTANGRHTRKRFGADDLSRAVQIGESLLFSVAEESDHLIGAVLGAWEATLTCSREAIDRDYHPYAWMFLEWLLDRQIERWADVQTSHLTAYAQELATQNLSKETIRKRTNPIRRAASFAARTWPGLYQDFGRDFVCPGQPAPPRRETADFAQIAEWCSRLRRDPLRRQIVPGIALTGFCGVRILEALRLTWEDYDAETGVLAIDGRKRGPSARSIPLPEFVRDILHEADREDRRILPYWDRNTYARAFRAMRPAAMGEVQPKNLRKCLPSEAFRAGWHSDYLELYLGHAPRGIAMVTWHHYISVDRETTIRLFRERVLGPLNEALDPYRREWRGADNVVTLRSPGP